MTKQTQREKFKQAARDIGTDNDEKRFNERLAKIAKPKTKPKAKKGKQ
jgi:hypothetical protein